MKSKFAIFSPNQNAYSETFIQAHKMLPFNIRYYYDGSVPRILEGSSIMSLSPAERINKKLLKGFSQHEKNLLYSLKTQKVRAVLAEYGVTAADTLDIVKHLNLPLIVHFHGYDITNDEVLTAYRERYLKVFDYAHTVVAVSEKMKADLIDEGCDPQKIILNPYGPANSFFDVKPDYAFQQFLSIGRFVEKKAPHLLLFAFSKVLQHLPNAQLKMIGDGILLPMCKDIVSQLKIEKNVSFLGVQPPSQVQSEMSQSLAFVQHSVTASNGDSEGTPVAVLEAQAAGLPVIATIHAGIPDVVLHNETGLLCEEKDVDAMANNMIRISQEKDLANRLGAAGRERIRQYFTMSKHLSVLEDVIREAIASRHLQPK